MSKKLLAALAVTALLTVSANAHSGEMTNADIVRMVQEQVAPGEIVNRIKDSSNSFDLSTDAVIALKENGVPDEVLAAMLVSSARGGAVSAPPPLRPPAGVSGMSGNLPPMRGFSGGGNAFPASDIDPPSLPGIDLSTAGFPGMEALDLPGLPESGGADPLAGGLAGLPTLPAIPSADMPGLSAEATAIATPMPAPTSMPSLTPPEPIPSGDFLASSSSDFSLPPVDFVDAGDDFYNAPSSSPAVTAAPAQTAAPDADTKKDEYEAAKARFEKEIVNVMAEAPEKKTSAVAWMLANQQHTLDLLREAMVKSERPDMESAAVYSLGRMRDAEAIPEIRRRLLSRNRLVRESAAEALAFMEDADAISAAEKALGQRAVDPMDGLIRLVGYARLVRASENLGKILSDSQVPLNRVAAAWSLTQIGRAGIAAWPAIQKAMTSDSSPDVRRQAARAVSSFHDEKESLKLMEAACRKDPEVRKVILEEFADYPDSIPFLVSIMNLKPDQIASDELEAARATLFKLTGEDFNQDGPRWKKWLADNRARLGLPQPPGAPSADGKIPPGMKKGPAHLAAGRPRQVDVRSWGIVADPMEIPLAPEVDDGPPQPRAGAAASGGARGGLAIPPPGLAGGPAGMRGPSMGGGYDEDDDYGPPSGGVGGGMFGGGGYGDDTAAASSGSSGGGALSGMRLPLSGLMGAGSGGDDAPPIPVGAGASSGMAGGMPPPAGLGGMSGMSGMGGGSTEAFEAPDSSFGGGDSYSSGYSGGYDSGSSYSSGSSYDSYGAGSSYDSYGSSYSSGMADAYQPTDSIVLPQPDYTPLSLDAYTKVDSVSDEVVESRTESTGELVPNLPIVTTTTMAGVDDLSDWEGSAAPTPSFEDDFSAASGSDFDYDEEEDFSESFAGGASSAAVPPPPAAVPPPPAAVPPPPAAVAPLRPAAGGGDSNVITFPGDTSTFGLGEPMFNEYGQPNGVEASELSTSAGGGTGGMVAPLSVEATAVAAPPAAVVAPAPGFVLPPPGAGRVAVSQSEDFEDLGDFEAQGDDFEDGVEPGYAEDDFSAPQSGFGGGGYEYDDGFESAEGGYDDADDFEDEGYASSTEAREVMDGGYGGEVGGGVVLPPPPGVGGGARATATVVAAPAGNSSPGASTLRLPARKRRKEHGESAIVSHGSGGVVGGVAEAEEVDALPLGSSAGSSVLERQAVEQRQSVMVTGPFRILDEEGRTAAIVMNSDDEILPATANEGDMYIQLDEHDGVISARELPASPVLPPPAPSAVGVPAGGGVSADVTVEASSPSQMPGRNFRKKR